MLVKKTGYKILEEKLKIFRNGTYVQLQPKNGQRIIEWIISFSTFTYLINKTCISFQYEDVMVICIPTGMGPAQSVIIQDLIF